ncbi:Leucine-rich repeat serine/threonine-protein kinase 1 [Trichoplax sp. H2]|nr:Leucine-rich repeat serine/threonine-protein kinase 1 [Trichoplax sp. H2]|eukprot:RDD43578.1 Leucine-rich repeat serine/threonine-protein kinase 1 [Trichoplax sp. H2]
MEEDQRDSGVDSFPGELLHIAARYDNIELLQQLLDEQEKTNISSHDERGRTALHTAAEMGSARCLTELVNRGLPVNIVSYPDDFCSTPLHHAAKCGHYRCVTILLDAGAVIHISDSKSRLPQDLAQQELHHQCVKILKKTALKRETQELTKGERDLFQACAKGDTQGVLKNINFVNRTTINISYDDSYTLLHRAIQSGNKSIVETLLQHGAIGAIHNHTGLSPLHMACDRGFTEIAALLLHWFPHLITFQSKDGNTPLHLAASHGHIDVINTLLNFRYEFKSYSNDEAIINILEVDRIEVVTPTDQPALKRWKININTPNGVGMTALHLAALAGQAEAVKLLITSIKGSGKQETKNESQRSLNAKGFTDDDSHISTLEIRSNTGSTPLHEAVNNGNVDTVKVLLDAGANINAVLQVDTDNVSNFNGNRNNLSVTSGLSPRPMNNNKTSPNNRVLSSPHARRHSLRQDFSMKNAKLIVSPLSLACDKGNKDIISLLLHHNVKDVDHTCLHHAIDNDHAEIVSIFLVHHGVQIDREYKVVANKTRFDFSSYDDLLHSYPQTPVSIDWHGLRLPYVHQGWLIAASNCLNPSSAADMMLNTITKLDLSSNHLKHFPMVALQLRSLRILNLNNNFISDLVLQGDDLYQQENIFKYSRLEDLMLANNCLQSLSTWIFHLPKLKALNISNNKIKELPYNIWIAPQLRVLNVSSNLLRELPVGNSNNQSNMSYYRPSNHEDRERSCSEALDEEDELLAETKSQLSLDDNDTSNNSIGQDSKSVSKQDSISLGDDNQQQASHENSSTNVSKISKNISVSNIRIAIESEDGQKSVQMVLDLDHGGDSASQSSGELTPVITRSRRADLLSERVTNVENENERILDSAESRLFILNIAHNQLSEIPEALACLAPNLSQLIISYNYLSLMPIPAMMPAALKLLDLSHNHIGNERDKNPGPAAPSPPSLVSCYSYRASTRRKPYNVASSWVHNFICRHRRHDCLIQLKTLDVSCNQLSDLDLLLEDVPDKNEETLKRFHEDLIGDTSKEFVKTIYPSLKSLDISNNNLKFVPKGIPYLSNLGSLNLSSNISIVSLPPEMGLLTKLWELSMDGLRLHDPPPSIMEQKKAKVITGYLLSRLQKSKPYRRMKLMFVGLQNIGKTSLLQRIKYGSKKSSKANQSDWVNRLSSNNQREVHKQKKFLRKRLSISTVGVDVGEWVCNRKTSFYKFGSLPEIKFSTWDFGGQKEYYATHQCFLSRRSLYILVWKMTDGEKGIDAMESWLVNIQARAPDSPVLIVGTHFDLLTHEQRQNDLPRYRILIRKKYTSGQFGGINNAREVGLPQVINMTEVSCKTGYGIKGLRTLIYDTAYNLRVSGCKDALLLEQLIPASYLALEEAMQRLSVSYRYDMKVPVLTTSEFRAKVEEELLPQGIKFRDMEELRQATKFLHDNGILLHYDDPSLCDLYFIDPQWLCDMLAHVVTIHAVNPFVKDGIMMITDMEQIFRNDNFPSSLRYQYISLLSKFEVALVIDNSRLLIPSLLPDKEPNEILYAASDTNSNHLSLGKTHFDMDASSATSHHRTCSVSSSNDSRRRNELFSLANTKLLGHSQQISETRRPPDSFKSLRRQYLMSYCPSGFWPRLVSRMMADENLIKAAKCCCTFDDVDMEAMDENDQWMHKIDEVANPVWTAWQNGIRLMCQGIELLRICERKYQATPSNTRKLSLSNKQHEHYISIFRSSHWRKLNISPLYMIEIYVPDVVILLRKYATAGSMEDMSDEGLFTPLRGNSVGSSIDLNTNRSHPSKLVADRPMGRYNVPKNNIELFQKEARQDQDDCEFLRDAIIIDNIDTVPTYYPVQACGRYASITESMDDFSDHLYETNAIAGNGKTSTHRLYALCIEHLDTLLEDWYPGLGARGLTTITGDPLIRRIVPCPYCIELVECRKEEQNDHRSDGKNQQLFDDDEVTTIKRSHTIGEFGFKHLGRIRRFTNKKEPHDSSSSATGNCLYDSSTDLSCKYNEADSIEEITKPDEVFSDKLENQPRRRKILAKCNSQGDYLNPESSSEDISETKFNTRIRIEQEEDANDIKNTTNKYRQLSIELSENSADNHSQERLNHLIPTRESRNQSVSTTDSDQSVRIHAFIFEECVLYSSQIDYMSCPFHGVLDMKFTVPDVIFHDLAPNLMISPDLLTKEYLLGKGAFGSVFKGELYDDEKLDEQPLPVAIKMMTEQGISENANTVDIAIIEAASKAVAADPTSSAYNAYRAARQEMSILVTVSHSNIVPIVGFCLNPLSLILPLAPNGSLDILLMEYRKHGCYLNIFTTKHIITQVASAMEYLHHQKIIYRDLKSENVLVWSIPSVEDANNDEFLESITVKVADYGISRSMLPTGTKGFSGTPGFMAPEIIKYGGEEVYTEKIDSFSFGMFMYELLTLKQPFEEIPTPQVNEYILEGKRPQYSRQKRETPLPLLELMRCCWNQDPIERPSFTQILDIANNPKFLRLIDNVQLVTLLPVTCGASFILSPDEASDAKTDETAIEQSMEYEIWLGYGETNYGEVNVLQFDNGLIMNEERIVVGKSAITCICVVDEAVWVGTQGGYLHIFNSTSHQLLLSQQVSDHFLISTTAIVHAMDQHLVAVALSDGKLITFKDVLKTPTRSRSLTRIRKEGSTSSDKSSSLESQDTDINALGQPGKNTSPLYGSWPHHINFKVGNIVNNLNKTKSSGKHPSLTLIECANKSFDCTIYSIIYVNYEDDNSGELWCGLAGGQVQILDEASLNIKCKLSIDHFHGNVINLATNAIHNHSCIKNHHEITAETTAVWAIGEDSCTIYSWSAMSKQALPPFDLSTVDTEHAILAASITSINIIDQYLYLGCSNGYLVVAHAMDRKVMTLFRCHQNIFYSLLPMKMIVKNTAKFRGDINRMSGGDPSESILEVQARQDAIRTQQLVVSCGKGFNDLFRPMKTQSNSTNLLIWRADQWS